MALEKLFSGSKWQAYADTTGTCLIFKCDSGSFRLGVSNEGIGYIASESGRIKIAPEASNRCGIEEH